MCVLYIYIYVLDIYIYREKTRSPFYQGHWCGVVLMNKRDAMSHYICKSVKAIGKSAVSLQKEPYVYCDLLRNRLCGAMSHSICLASP